MVQEQHKETAPLFSIARAREAFQGVSERLKQFHFTPLPKWLLRRRGASDEEPNVPHGEDRPEEKQAPLVEENRAETWKDILPSLLPFTADGELNPLARRHMDSKENPFWDQTPLHKGSENGEMPFGLTAGFLERWGLDFTGALHLNEGLLELFQRLTDLVEPSQIQALIEQMPTITEEDSSIEFANELINGIWRNIYSHSNENPRSVQYPDMDAIVGEARENKTRALSYWFTLKAYFSVAMSKIYGGCYQLDADSVGIEPSTLLDEMIEKAFMWTYGPTFQADPGKPREDLVIRDMSGEGEETFRKFHEFYGKLFGNPFLVANGIAEYVITRSQHNSSLMKSVYEDQSAKAAANISSLA